MGGQFLPMGHGGCKGLNAGGKKKKKKQCPEDSEQQ